MHLFICMSEFSGVLALIKQKVLLLINVDAAGKESLVSMLVK